MGQLGVMPSSKYYKQQNGTAWSPFCYGIYGRFVLYVIEFDWYGASCLNIDFKSAIMIMFRHYDLLKSLFGSMQKRLNGDCCSPRGKRGDDACMQL
jgi:hypothetical protein